LNLTLMSSAVKRMAAIASSSVTLYTPPLAMDSCAAVTAFTAEIESVPIGTPCKKGSVTA
jgi:hypothetical protein